MKGWRKELIVFAVCGFLVLLYVCNLRRTSPNRDNVKLREVQELSSKLPVFPGFSEVGSDTTSGYTVVDVTKHYSSKSEFDAVKAFYRNVLERDGWIVYREDPSSQTESSEIAFKKEQLSITIFHTRNSVVYNYAINFVWDGSELN